MITFSNIKLQNFMSIKSLDIDFNPNQMTIISGENGSGKSSLFYALAYAISGYRKGEKASSYVTVGEDYAKIEIEGEFDGYPIYYDVIIGGETVNKTPSKRSVTYKDTTYTNSEYNQFLKEFGLSDIDNYMFMFQGLSSSFIDSNPSTRADRIKKTLDIQFDSITEKFKSELDKAKSDMSEMKGKIAELQSKNFETHKLLREIPEFSIENWTNRLKEVESILSDLEKIKEEDLTECEYKLKDTQKYINDFEKKILTERNNISVNTEKIDGYNKFLSSYDEIKILNDIDNLKKELLEHQKSYEIAKESVNQINKELSIRNYELSELIEQIKISETGVCHACGQSVDSSHVDSLNEKKSEVEKAIRESKDTLKEIKFDPKDTESTEIKNNIKSNEEIISNLKDYRSRIKILEDKNKYSEEHIEEMTVVLNKYNEDKKVLIDKMSSLEQIKPIISEKETLSKEKRELNENILNARDIIIKNNERKAFNEKVEIEKADRDKKLEELLEEYNNLSMAIDNYKTCIEVYEKSFPSYIITVVCESLSNYINDIVQRVFPYMKVKLSQDKSGLNFFYTSEVSNEHWISVSMASGAQKQILSLAFALALGKLHHIKSIFLDEIDAACSSDSSSIIYEFISTVTDFPQISFVSHRQEAIQSVMDSNRTDIVAYSVKHGEYNKVS